MARIHPGHPERLLPYSQQYQEVRTLNRLQSGLPDTIAVYHSVHHGRMEGGRQRFGEIDFVLVNQAGDILLIEQKNGPLIETAEGLKKDYGQKTKNVVSQVLTGRTAVMQQLTDVFHGTPPVDVKILLYCPDHRIENPGTSGLDPAQIVDATLPPHLERWILDHLREGNPDGGRQTRAAHCGSGLVRENKAKNRGMTEQSLMNPLPRCSARNVGDSLPTCGGMARQVRDWASLTQRPKPNHLFEKARKEGRRPLMLCFNSVLGAALQHALGEHRDVGTFHQWCRRMLELAGGTFDEAQDFDAEWWQILRVFEATDAPIRILCPEDGEQNIYGRSGPDIEHCVHYRSNAVYRTPQRIARFIDRLLKPNLEWRSPFDGFDLSSWHLSGQKVKLPHFCST